MYDNLVLGKGSLTDNIYIGTLNKAKTHWIHKKDITNNFLQVVLERFNGYEEILSDGKKKYKIRCEEVKEE
jgi:hypothetical protein